MQRSSVHRLTVALAGSLLAVLTCVVGAPPAVAAGGDTTLDVLKVVDGEYVVETVVVPSRSAEERAEELAEAPDVVAAGPQVTYQVDGTTDPYWRDTDPGGASDVTSVWPRTRGAGQLVAVLDTAATLTHPDLVHAAVPGTDIARGPGDPWHGVGVAGVVAAQADNGIGGAGMAPDAEVMPVRVCDDDGGCTSADVARGVLWAVDRGADVINMSLSGRGYSDVQAAAVQYALDKGISVVASAGNDGVDGNPVMYPAALSGVIGVSATTQAGAPADWAVHGWQVDVSTVGDSVLVPMPTDTYGNASGTSFSGPAVAGAVALLRSGHPGIEPEAVQAALQAGAESSTWDRTYGAGRLDVPAAFAAADRTGAPVTVIPSSQAVDVSWDAVPGATGYTVRVDGVVQATGPGTTARVTGLTDGTQVAVDVQPDGGDRSRPVLATVGGATPATPVLHSAAIRGTSSSAVLDLRASVDGAAAPRYEILRDGMSIGSSALALTSTPTTFAIGIGAMPTVETRWQLRPQADLGRISAASNAVVAGSGRPAPPSAITGLAAQERDGEVLLTWDDQGTALTYRVSVAGAVVATPRTAGAVVAAPPPGQPRAYEVSAVDAWEQTGPAASVEVGTAVPTAPGAPTGVTAVAGNGQATVSWSAAPANGSPVTGYRVTASPGGATATTTGATSATVTGLANGTPYTFAVTAANAVGTGPASARSTAVTPVQPTAITVAHQALGGNAGRLGAPTSEERCGLRSGGCFRTYANGSIYWTTATGARAVTGLAAGRWAAQGWENGPLGYPVTSTECVLAGGGCYQHFQGGTIMSSPATGAWPVTGGLRDGWFRTGSEGGVLGYPTAAAVCGLRDGGCLQRFERGTLYSSPATGARAVTNPAADAWARQGWERGALGYPVTDTTCGLRDGGCYQHFQGGTVMYSPASGSWALSGPLRDGWFRAGSEGGVLGYPTAAAVCGLRDGGCLQRFAGGSLYWSAATGAHPVRAGAIADRWGSLGWERGMGYPLEAERAVSGGRAQRFQGGTLTLSTTTGEVRRS